MTLIPLYIALVLVAALQIYLLIGFYYVVTFTPKEPMESKDFAVHLFELLFYWPWMKNK